MASYRATWCSACETTHEQFPAYEICPKYSFPKTSHLPSPMIIGDTMEAVQSMLDGKMYESKSALRRTYKQAGVNEVGNDSSIMNPKPKKKPKPNMKAIGDSVEKAFARAGFGA
jgi:hypothetical protein